MQERQTLSTTFTSSPRGSTLAEQELISSLSWLIALRWLAGIGVLLATWFATVGLGVNLPAIPLYLLGVGILAYNLTFWWGLDRLKASPSYTVVVYQWFARFQIGLDWAAMALLVHFSGGIESPALYYFLFHITIASLLLPHDRGFIYVTLGPLLIGGLAFLEYQGLLPHYFVFESTRHNDILYILGVLFFFTSAAYVMAYLSMTISRRLRRREDGLTGLYQSVQATTSTLELTEVLNRLAEATTKALSCKAAAIRLLDETGSFLELAGVYGLSEAYKDKPSIEIAYARIDQEALAGNTILVKDATRDDRLRYPDKIAAEGIRTILSTPLTGKQGPIGVLRAYGDAAYRFTQDDADFLKTIASEGVIAIENAQAYRLLAELDKNKSQFVRMVTHELRSPVQVTLTLLNVLGQSYVGDLNEKQTDLVRRAKQRLRFLQTLVDDLLDLAAGRADVLPAAGPGFVSLVEVFEEIQTRFEALAQDKGLVWKVVYPDKLLKVRGDKNEFDRLISNLVSNAIKYTQAGEVCLQLRHRDAVAHITIADTGIGIPKDALPHLFEEFYRAKNAKALQAKGTGLGLSITKDLVERYEGRIEVESVEGQGTTVTLILPLVKGVSE